MVGDCGSNGHQRTARLTTRRRVVGVGAAVGAFVAFGVAPLAAAPAAHAEDFGLGELIADLFGGVGEVTGGVGDVVDDTGAAATQAALEAGGQGFDHALAAAETPLQQFFYDPVHAAIEGWINSSDPTPFLDGLNQFSAALGLGPMIADGGDGTAEHVDGFAGGWLFGDGGNGWDATGTDEAGGDGGAASWFGDGGDGGDGGAGAAGGDGGDGGSLFGDGGAGGDAGDGVYSGPGDLPALGGAGGNGGLYGSHGAVGDYGTLAGAPDPETDGLTTTGAWITDSDGKVVILHGLNQVYKIPPFTPSAVGFGDDDAALLAEHGFNVVRLGVIWAGVEPQPGVIDYDYLASIEQTVQTLADHNIRVILDMHQDGYSSVFGGEGAPEWAVQTGGLANPDLPFPFNIFFNPASYHAWDAFWSNADASDGVGLENHYAQMWEAVAGYFNDNSNLAGYEIMNEPWVGSYGLGPHFGAQVLTPFYDQAASAIRAVDPNTPVFFEPNLAASNGLPIGLGEVDDPHGVFSYHDYLRRFLPEPLANISGDNAAAYAASHDIPAFITEFGSGADNATIGATMQSADEHMFGWTEWEYTDQGDITTTGGGHGWLVHDPSQPPVGDNVDWDKLAVLAEPYPQVVAGTPLSWSFDSAGSGAFHFSYSTEMADGTGSFEAGAQTEISVPATEYPNGYQVSVTGGHVVPGPDTSILVVESDGSAETVTVTVSAAAAS